MKTTTYIKAIAVFIMVSILTAGISIAAKPEKRKDAQDIRIVLKQNLQSKFLKEDGLQGTVDFTFTINDDGSLNYRQFLSSNPAIEKYVRNTLSAADLKGYAGTLKQTYNIRFTFIQI